MTETPDELPLLDDAIVSNLELAELTGLPVESIASPWDDDSEDEL